MRTLRPWVGIALLAPMLILAVSASSFIGLRCRMTGMVSLAACCPEQDVPAPPLQSTVDEPGCCERIVLQVAKPIANTGGDGAAAVASPPSTPVAILAATDPSLGRSFAYSLAAWDLPRISRLPVRLLKHSLLI